MMKQKYPNPRKGEVWEIDPDPNTMGSEMREKRPHVVVSEDEIGRLPLRITAPFTGWEAEYSNYVWMIPIEKTECNGLIQASFGKHKSRTT